MFVSLCLLAAASICSINAASAPVFPAQYYVEGVFNIPYFNISEPIELWYDATNNRAVVSYYNGIDKFITFGNQNTTYIIGPQIDTLVCQKAVGYFGPLLNLFVDLGGWEYEGTTTINDLKVQDWRLSMVNYSMPAQYDFYVVADRDSSNPIPVQLLLNGVDFLFDSHPDVYVLNYNRFVPNYVDEDVFQIPAICQNASEVSAESFRMGVAGTVFEALRARPSSAAAPNSVERQFQAFMAEHGKQYATTEEYQRRLSIFTETLQFIQTHNANPSNSHQVGLNRYADMTKDEFRGQILPRKGRTQSHATRSHQVDNKPLPDHVDWRQKGAVTPVKDQGTCGSCYSFGSTGSLEGVYYLHSGHLISLSEQQIMDCSWTAEGNQGCNGGEASYVYDWILENGGIATEKSYPYLMQNVYCDAHNKDSKVQITGYANVTMGDEEALKHAVATQGPVAIAIDASHDPFRYYLSGVYYQADCGNTLDDLDHEVLVVGYGTYNGSDYWLVKNSWSTNWGDEGYVMMARNRGNNCGIATQPNFPYVK